MNNHHHNNTPELSEAELLEMVDANKAKTHGYDGLFSHIAMTKSSIMPDEAFVQKLVLSLPTHETLMTSGGLSEVKSPYTERFARFSAVTLSSWKVATPIAVVVLVFSVVFGRGLGKQDQDHTPMLMAVNTTSGQAENVAVAPSGTLTLSQDGHASVAEGKMMMATKSSPAPSSADGVIALLSSEVNADASTTTSNSDISLLSIDPSSVTDLNQTYDAATN